MTGFNRWGATWCGANQNLLTGFLREDACGGNLLVGNGSSEDCADVWIGYERQGEYDERKSYCFYGG